MKTEYKKTNELLALENADVLNEFEMVQLQGGKNLWVCDSKSGNGCTVTNVSKCNDNCSLGEGCHVDNGCN